MKLKKISLRSLNDNAMREKEQSHLMGGLDCGCGCNGPSSISSNMSANYSYGIISPGTCHYLGYDGESMDAVVQTKSYA